MPNTSKLVEIDHVREKLIELIRDAKYEVDRICVERDWCDGCSAAYGEGNCKEAYIADHLVANGVTVQKWIPVTERLPDLELAEAKSNDCDSYVCLTAKRGFANKDQIFIIKAWYYGDRFENDDGIDITDDVTHWMPLPQPPKGE